jgi:hypothetical protein
MNDGSSKADVLVNASAVPLVRELIADFKGCSPWAAGNWNRVTDNENTRFTRWPGQHPDGKKHDRQNAPAFPFDGASDTRIPLADEICNENVAVCFVAFWRAMIQKKAGESEESDYAVKLADYYVNTVLFEDLVREVELSEQYRQMLGWVVLHPFWNLEICLAHRPVTMEELVGLANSQEATGNSQMGTGGGNRQGPIANSQTGTGGMSALALLPQMIMDPTLDSETAKILEALYEMFCAQQVQDVDVKMPALRPAKIKQAIRELREGGETTLPLPYVSKNQPEILALKPWDEIFIPNYSTDIQKGPRVYRRVWMSEVELRSKIVTDGWDPEWVEEALKHKGKFSSWTTDGGTSPAANPPTSLTDAMSGQAASWVSAGAEHGGNDLVEVIYATHRQLDEDNVPGVFLTVFNVNVCEDGKGKVLYGEHGLLEGVRGEFPYVTGQRENWSRNITASRGVPQIAGTWQREVKVQRDGLVDHTSLGVTPPVLVPKGAMGTKLKFAPAQQNEVTVGREPKFMEVPQGGSALALELGREVRNDVANYFGQMAAEVPPTRVQLKQTMLTIPFLMMWSKALQMVLGLAQANLGDAEFARITGAPPGWLEARRYSYGLLSANLHFDVRELDPEYVLKQLDTINKAVLPGDVAGVIDRAKYTKLQLRAINPALARELVADEQQASQAIFKEVQNDIALMFLGNEPEYVEMDPTAQTKLKFAGQIVQTNPMYQQALQEKEGRFAGLMEKWAMNLQFSIKQEQNKQVGKIGVQPGQAGPGAGAGI